MVFVRVNLIRDRLTAEQKKELGAKLVQAVADVELLVNNTRHQEMSWVQYYEFDPENWYAPANLPGTDSDSRIQLDVITPQKLVSTPEEARTLLENANAAVRSVFGSELLPTGGPWVLVHVIPYDQWGVDGQIPDWDGFAPTYAPRRRSRRNRPWPLFTGPTGAQVPESRGPRRRSRSRTIVSPVVPTGLDLTPGDAP